MQGVLGDAVGKQVTKWFLWNDAEEQRLRDAYLSPGTTVKGIARDFGLTYGQIENRIRKLGLSKPMKPATYVRTITPEGRAGWAAKQNTFGFELIEQNSIPEPNSGCWLWTGACTGAGYGAIAIGGKLWGAHRVSYAAFHNTEIQTGYLIRHSCDNPPCVNPDHLLLGTVKDNSRDAIDRDRTPWGREIWTAKLSPEDIPSIRGRLAKGEIYTSIAADFGVSPSNIGYIKKSRSWRRVE